jgi:hypothetical protein
MPVQELHTESSVSHRKTINASILKINVMKYFKKSTFILQTGIMVILFLTLISLDAGVGGDKTDLASDKELRQNVFNQILTNRELFYEFMNNMMRNRQSMNWMMENGSMMQMMFNENNLQYIMHQNMNMSSYMFSHMMGAAQNDSTLRMQWNDMMNNHGHMDMMNMHNQ